MGKIINADCLVVLPQIPSKSIDLIITSPPYDNLRKYGDTKWNMNIFQQVANQLWRVLKSGGVVVWIVGDQIKNGGRTLTSLLFMKKLEQDHLIAAAILTPMTICLYYPKVGPKR